MHSCKAVFTHVVIDSERKQLSQSSGASQRGQLIQNKVIVRGSARLEAQLEVDVVNPGQLQEDKSGVSRGKSVRDMQRLRHAGVVPLTLTLPEGWCSLGRRQNEYR